MVLFPFPQQLSVMYLKTYLTRLFLTTMEKLHVHDIVHVHGAMHEHIVTDR